MLKYAAFFAVLGFAWSQSTGDSQAATSAAPAAATTANPIKFYYDKYYHQVVMLTEDTCYFHQLSSQERYDAKDAAGLKAIENKIWAAEKKLQEFGTETSHNHYFYSYSFEIRKACQGKETYKITSSA